LFRNKTSCSARTPLVSYANIRPTSQKKKSKRGRPSGAISLATGLAANRPSFSRAETQSPPTGGLARARRVNEGWPVQGHVISRDHVLAPVDSAVAKPPPQSRMVLFESSRDNTNYEEMQRGSVRIFFGMIIHDGNAIIRKTKKKNIVQKAKNFQHIR
jgi:hypothetical protein